VVALTEVPPRGNGSGRRRRCALLGEEIGASSGVDEDAQTIGRRLRQIRQSRRKSLRVVAELAGISAGHLSRIENGQRALDRRSLIVALADALQISPTELTSLPIPAPDNGTTDASIDAVRRALLAATTGLPGGDTVDADILRSRVADVLDAQQACHHDTVAAALPRLIRDLHTSLASGHDAASMLRLVALLHVQGIQAWLRDIGAPLDLAWQSVTLSPQAAEQLDDPRPKRCRHVRHRTRTSRRRRLRPRSCPARAGAVRSVHDDRRGHAADGHAGIYPLPARRGPRERG
jgi:transcriptional regulator with XRE-family HTH domain